jgi:hypothetical protein
MSKLLQERWGVLAGLEPTYGTKHRRLMNESYRLNEEIEIDAATLQTIVDDPRYFQLPQNLQDHFAQAVMNPGTTTWLPLYKIKSRDISRGPNAGLTTPSNTGRSSNLSSDTGASRHGRGEQFKQYVISKYGIDPADVQGEYEQSQADILFFPTANSQKMEIGANETKALQLGNPGDTSSHAGKRRASAGMPDNVNKGDTLSPTMVHGAWMAAGYDMIAMGPIGDIEVPQVSDTEILLGAFDVFCNVFLDASGNPVPGADRWAPSKPRKSTKQLDEDLRRGLSVFFDTIETEPGESAFKAWSLKRGSIKITGTLGSFTVDVLPISACKETTMGGGGEGSRLGISFNSIDWTNASEF